MFDEYVLDYEEFLDCLTEYLNKLTRDFGLGKISHKQYLKSLRKLDEWEEMYVQRFELFEEDEDD